jgi:hypothetical protein
MPQYIQPPHGPLPPPGYERNEELAWRRDQAQQAGEQAAGERGVYAVNPRAMRPDYEILQAHSSVTVTNASPAFVYSWANYVNEHGRAVHFKRTEDWEVVCGDMPEAIERKGIGADTTRRIGDVLLMRRRLDKHIMWERRYQMIKDMKLGNTASQLEELADRYRGTGVIVRTDPNDPKLRMYMNVAQSTGQAQQAFNGAVRGGYVPGAPPPGYGAWQGVPPEAQFAQQNHVNANAQNMPGYQPGYGQR